MGESIRVRQMRVYILARLLASPVTLGSNFSGGSLIPLLSQGEERVSQG